MHCSSSVESMADMSIHALDGQSFMKALKEAHRKCFERETGFDGKDRSA